MEISSEHGHNIRDEDIDIDIDLTTGHADEDYILEDALPHDDDFLFEASTTVGNDDLMVDEDDETYHANHLDTDFIPQDHSQNMVDHASAVSFTAPSGPEFYVEDHGTLNTDHFEVASTKESEVTLEHEDAPNDALAENGLQPQDQQELAIHEDGRLDGINAAEVEVKEVAAPTTPPDDTNSGPPSAPHSPKAPTPAEHPNDPSDSLAKPTDESPKQIVGQDHLDTSVSHEFEEGLHGDSEEIHNPEDSHVPTIPEILVAYQETEYALFSTSELDDPDSFFLSDTSILDSPISHFFQAIRDVIHEDLAGEDELCLSIGDMGIEVEEVSYSTLYYSQKQG